MEGTLSHPPNASNPPPEAPPRPARLHRDDEVTPRDTRKRQGLDDRPVRTGPEGRQHTMARVVSRKSLASCGSRKAPGRGVGAEPTPQGSGTDEPRGPAAFPEPPEGPRGIFASHVVARSPQTTPGLLVARTSWDTQIPRGDTPDISETRH